MSEAGRRGAAGVGRQWLGLCLALAIHAADEAFTGFLPVYNDAVRAITELFPFVPAPSLTLAVWLWSSVAFVGGLTLLVPLAYKGVPWMRVATIGVALIALANVSGHVGGSIFAGRLMPGVYSAPVLAIAGIYGLVGAWRWRPEQPAGRVS